MSSEARFLVNVGNWLSHAVARGLGQETIEELIENDESEENIWHAFLQGWVACEGEELIGYLAAAIGVDVECTVAAELESILTRIGGK